MACISPGRKSGGPSIIRSVSPERTTGIQAPKACRAFSTYGDFIGSIHGLASMAVTYRAFSTWKSQLQNLRAGGTKSMDHQTRDVEALPESTGRGCSTKRKACAFPLTLCVWRGHISLIQNGSSISPFCFSGWPCYKPCVIFSRLKHIARSVL